MHECKGIATITLKIVRVPISGQFNSNYKGGIEVLEEEAQEMVASLLPSDFELEFLDVTISDYEHKTLEREVEDD
jgi:hypothetical protein